MKATIKIEKEVNLKKILVSAGVRYWNDCKYSKDNKNTWRNGSNEEDIKEVSEDFRNNIPFVEKKDIGHGKDYYWNLIIDIDTGKVENWPKDFCIETWFKVCDDGLYQILDENNNIIWDSVEFQDYYVPKFLSIGSEGYGDYIYIDINGDGYIKDWEDEAIPVIKELLNN